MLSGRVYTALLLFFTVRPHMLGGLANVLQYTGS